jgi:hypothetical protein
MKWNSLELHQFKNSFTRNDFELNLQHLRYAFLIPNAAIIRIAFASLMPLKCIQLTNDNLPKSIQIIVLLAISSPIDCRLVTTTWTY